MSIEWVLPPEKNLGLSEKQLNILKKIVEKYSYTFKAFGSRVSNNYQKFSDLDLCIVEELSLNERSRIMTDFEESDLPFKIDLVEEKKISDTFIRNIEKDFVLVQKLK